MKTGPVFCTIVKNQVEYNESLWAERDARRQKQAAKHGYELVPPEEDEE
jgi:hypothetical protein